MTMKIATGFAAKCPTCKRMLEPMNADAGTENRFDVYEASSNDYQRKEASGLWLIEQSVSMLVAESWEDDNDFVEAIMLHDYEEPGFTTVEFADAKRLGMAQVKIGSRGPGDLSAPLCAGR